MVMGSNVVYVEIKSGGDRKKVKKKWEEQSVQMQKYLNDHFATPPNYESYLFKLDSFKLDSQWVKTINPSVNMEEFDPWFIEMISRAKTTVDKKLALDFLLRSTLVLATSLQEIDSDGISCKLFVLR